MKRTAGFTLIELLVVVAIIALLISILLPSLNQARRQARMLIDATNQRQIVTAVTLYADTNGDHLPPAISFNETTQQWSHPTWLTYNLPPNKGAAGGRVEPFIGTYLPDPQIFVCPFQPGLPTRFAEDYTNPNAEGLQAAYFLLWGYEGYKESNGFIGKRRLSDVRRSDLFTSERLMWNDPGGQFNWIANHRFGAAAAFVTAYRAIWHQRPVLDEPWPDIPTDMYAGYADGHVERYSIDDVVEAQTPTSFFAKTYIPEDFGPKWIDYEPPASLTPQ